MTILVTGAAGFIGAHVTRALLERGERVVGIDNLNDYYDPALKRARLDWIGENPNFRFEILDFAERDAVAALGKREAFERIVHLGAQAGVRYSLDHPHAYVDSNLVGQINLLELARAQRCEHFVYASSSSVYGGNETLPFAETDHVDHPVSLYAATKRGGELMAQSYAHLYRIPMTGLRFFTVYGPWGRPDMAVWKFTEAMIERREMTVFDIDNQARDFTYIDDIVAGTLAAINRAPGDDELPDGPHAIYNLGGHHPEPLAKLVRVLEDATGETAIVDHQDAQPGDVSRTAANIDAARADLGFAPSTRLEDGAKAFVEWYRAYRKANTA